LSIKGKSSDLSFQDIENKFLINYLELMIMYVLETFRYFLGASKFSIGSWLFPIEKKAIKVLIFIVIFSGQFIRITPMP